jgi:eukaryotic-like serine/threonine-protein kinase
MAESSFAREFPELAQALAGQFRVERDLGRGGMGVVYVARELKLDRLVALKVLPATLARDPATLERFLREARTAAHLAHPNVVPVYRADEAGGTAFFAMAFIEGESLGDRVRDRGPLPAADAVPILRSVAWALAYAHARGVVHRDVKPENILLERTTGRTLVTDFGIARQSLTEEAARLTQDGHVLGTLHYMSPEQVNDAPLDGRSDLYALGVVAYFVLSGRLPFEGLSPSAVLVAHAMREPPPLMSVAPPNVPPALAAVVERCLAKRPEDRFETGEELAEALDRAVEEGPSARAHDAPFAPGLPERVDAEQAAAIWKRAAQLQADALHRLEVRQALALGTTVAGEDGTVQPNDAATQGYRLADVAGAAAEAGISRQYVAMALAELPQGTLPANASRLGMSERTAARFLGTDVRSIGVSVVIAASPARTLRALGAVLQQSPYELQLRETVGPHPLDGGIVVFDLTGKIVGLSGASGATMNRSWMALQQQLEARQVQVTLRGVPGQPGQPERTEVTMVADLRPGVLRNVRASQWIAGGVGSGVGFFVGGILAKGAATALSVAVLGPATAAIALAAGGCLLLYRKYYPSVLRKAEDEMRQALGAVSAALQSESVFGVMPGPGRHGRGTPTGTSGDTTTTSIVRSF